MECEKLPEHDEEALGLEYRHAYLLLLVRKVKMAKKAVGKDERDGGKETTRTMVGR